MAPMSSLRYRKLRSTEMILRGESKEGLREEGNGVGLVKWNT